MNGSGLSGIRCFGEGCFSRKERKERKDDGRVEERGLDGRVEHVERAEGGEGGRVDRVEGLTQRRRGAEYAEDDGKLPSADGGLRLLYLGRRHPLKGVEYLETAVRQIKESSAHSASLRLCVKIISSAFGEELKKVWEWCDVLVLPTLSDNFGLVIAEALERGKRVITTDGAPAWNHEIHETHEKGVWSGYGGRLIYLKGYRDGTPEDRVRLLKSAIENLLCPASLTPPASHASLTSPAVK